jgi:hypothetical protein
MKTVFFASRLGGTSDSNFIPLFGGTRNTQCITAVNPAIGGIVFLDLNEKS